MLYNYPKIYAKNLPEDFVHDNPNVQKAMEGSHVTSAPWNNLLTLTSSAGQQFLSFAKFRDYGQGQCSVSFILYDSDQVRKYLLAVSISSHQLFPYFAVPRSSPG